MAKIMVPKTPMRAYDPNRRPSDLIRRQIQHLEWALLPAAQRNPKQLRKGTVRTEAQAAEYIALLTERLHEAYGDRKAAPDAGPLTAVKLPKVPKAPRPARPRAAKAPARSTTVKKTAKRTAPKKATRRGRR